MSDPKNGFILSGIGPSKSETRVCNFFKCFTVSIIKKIKNLKFTSVIDG